MNLGCWKLPCVWSGLLWQWFGNSSQAKKETELASQWSILRALKGLQGWVLQEPGLTAQGALLSPLLLISVLKPFNAPVGITWGCGEKCFLWLHCLVKATAHLGRVTSSSQALCLAALSQLLASRSSSCLCCFWFNSLPALNPFSSYCQVCMLTLKATPCSVPDNVFGNLTPRPSLSPAP